MSYFLLLLVLLVGHPLLVLHPATTAATVSEAAAPAASTDDTSDDDDISALLGSADDTASTDAEPAPDSAALDSFLKGDDATKSTESTNDESDTNSSATDETPEDDDPNAGPGTYTATEGADISFPVLGMFNFAPSPEALADKTATPSGVIRKQTIDKAGPRDVAMGLVGLKGLTGCVNKTGHLSMSGTCSLNGKEGTVSLLKYDQDSKELILKLAYDQKPFTFNILPNQEVSVSQFKLTLGASGPELTADSGIFTPNNKKGTLLTFGTELTGNSGATGTIKDEVPLVSIIPQAKGNKNAESITLTNVSISFLNPLAAQQELMENGGVPTTTITASASLSQIKLFGQTHLTDSDVTIMIAGPSIMLTSEGTTPIQLDQGVALESPNIQMNLAQGAGTPDIGLGGTLSCDLPVIGTLKTPVHGRKAPSEFELSGSINNTYHWGPVDFKNPLIQLQCDEAIGEMDNASGTGKTLNISMSCIFDLFGLKITPIMRFLKPDPNNVAMIASKTKSGRIISFSGQINGGKPIKPLKEIPGLSEIPGLKDFLLERAEIGGDSASKAFVGGATTLFGVATQAKILMGKAKAVMASTTQPWRISDSIPSLKGNLLDSLQFESITFGYTKAPYLDPETGIVMQPGLNMFGAVDMSQGIFKELRKIFKVVPKKLIGGVTIHPNPRECKVQIAIPLDVKLGSRASLHNIMFELNGSPGIALMVSLAFYTGKSDPPLIFTARIEFEPGFFTTSGSLQGVWNRPFSIPGLVVSDVAIEATFPYTLLPPVGFGITGAIELGDVIAKAAVKIAPDNMILLAEVNEWPLFCLPAMLRMVGLNLPGLDVVKAIDIGFHDVKFKFAPAGGQIGMIYFDPGISASGRLVLKIPYIINAQLAAGFNLDWVKGFKLYATMPAIKLGPLSITGKGMDGKWNTADDGPTFLAELSLFSQKLLISGLVELFGSKAEIEVDVGILHLKFYMAMKLLGLLDAHIIGETYRDGWQVGFKALGTAKLGKVAEATIFGDINTLGCSFAGKYDALTLHDVADICHLPKELVPEFGLTNIEFYVRAQG